MARIVARNASLYLEDSAGASRSLSGLANSITLTQSAEAPEVTAFGESTRVRLSDGLKDWEVTADIFYAAGANETDIVLNGIYGGSSLFQFGPAGSSSGSTKYSGCGILTEYAMTFGVADAGTGALTFVPRAGSLTRGTWA
jgi:hypothetical protein